MPGLRALQWLAAVQDRRNEMGWRRERCGSTRPLLQNQLESQLLRSNSRIILEHTGAMIGILFRSSLLSHR
jgi:hypothetical protein